MRLITALKKNLVPILFVVVVAAILIYMTQRKEGFATCNATNCAAKGGSWINDKCYKPCSSTGTGNVVYQECITPVSRDQYPVINPFYPIPDDRIHSICNSLTPLANVRTLNTFCGKKLRLYENKPSGSKIARPTFSSC
jgi:hypothetical protein